MARPGAATARPGAAMARPGKPGSKAPPPRGEASINPWPGRYLETVVLFRSVRKPTLTAALEKTLERGGGADFQRIRFEGS